MFTNTPVANKYNQNPPNLSSINKNDYFYIGGILLTFGSAILYDNYQARRFIHILLQ